MNGFDHSSGMQKISTVGCNNHQLHLKAYIFPIRTITCQHGVQVNPATEFRRFIPSPTVVKCDRHPISPGDQERGALPAHRQCPNQHSSPGLKVEPSGPHLALG